MPLKKARLKISDYNEKRKTRLKNTERRVRMVSLSLTSMVDMFAILVIFLLTNASTVTQWIELAHQIELPKAKFSDPPPKAATLQITREAVFADTKRLLSTSQAMHSTEVIRVFLSQLSGKVPKKERYVNIVADYRVPYGVIRRVVSSCQEAGFNNVNLAVQPKG